MDINKSRSAKLSVENVSKDLKPLNTEKPGVMNISAPGKSYLSASDMLAEVRRKYGVQNTPEVATLKPAAVVNITKDTNSQQSSSNSSLESWHRKYLNKSNPVAMESSSPTTVKIKNPTTLPAPVSLTRKSGSTIASSSVSNGADEIEDAAMLRKRAEMARLKEAARLERENKSKMGSGTPQTPVSLTSFSTRPAVIETEYLKPSQEDSKLRQKPPSKSAEEETPKAVSNPMAALLQQAKLLQKQEIAQSLIDKEAAKAKFTSSVSAFNRSSIPPKILEQRSRLPVHSHREDFIEALRNNQFLIVTGETGSGKSTQLPQYIYEAGLHGEGQIGITQPRKIAAKFLAERVSHECNVKLGTLVGYTVRFDTKESDQTIIKYLTDGKLFRECARDKDLSRYSIVIIDEAHERSIDSDVCLGLLKRAAKRRPELKVIISSATIQTEKFRTYFNNAPVFKITGKSYPVTENYLQYKPDDYVAAAIDKVIEIAFHRPSGDILVFLPGKDSIDEMRDKLEEKLRERPMSLVDEVFVIPCYSGLPPKDAEKAFKETAKGKRKCVLATNVAETSITIDGIVYVVDSGRYKESRYNPKTGMKILEEKMVSQFQAIQRMGRAGRTRPGVCYRLYSEQDFMKMEKSCVPEIARSNLESVLLNLTAMGIEDIDKFEFLDSPQDTAVEEAFTHLHELGALDENRKLTSVGKKMASLPVDPPLAKVLLESEKLGCVEEILTIAALAGESSNLFYGSAKYKRKVQLARDRFKDPHGDPFLWLNVYNAWLANDQSEEWCFENGIQWKVLDEAAEIREQLHGELQCKGIGFTTKRGARCPPEKISEFVRKSYLAGHFRQCASKKERGFAYSGFLHPDAPDTYLHGSSCLFKIPPPFVIYTDVVITKRPFMRGVIEIELEWVAEYAHEFFKRQMQKYGSF